MSLFLLVLIVAQAADSQTFRDPAAGYSFTVPADFAAEEGDSATIGAPRCWMRAGSAATWMRLCVTRLSGELPRDDEALSGEQGMASTPFTWKSFTIPGVRSTSEAETGSTTMFQAVVPLRSNAVRLMMMSPVEEAESARAVLANTIASLEGESSWLASTERAERTGEAIGQIGAIIMAIGVGMWIMQRRQKKTARPTRKPGKS
jgi:hypothetical protein